MFCGCGDTLATGLTAGDDIGNGGIFVTCLFVCSECNRGSPTCTLASLLLVSIK